MAQLMAGWSRRRFHPAAKAMRMVDGHETAPRQLQCRALRLTLCRIRAECRWFRARGSRGK